MSRFVGPLAPALEGFVRHKRGLGYGYASEAAMLEQFSRFAAANDHSDTYLSETLVRGFVLHRPERSRSTTASLLRSLGKYLLETEPRTFVAPPKFLGRRLRPPTARVLSRAEARLFWEHCAGLAEPEPRSPLRRLVHGEALRLLLQTGLRAGEARDLRDAEVDVRAGVIRVRKGKFGKERLVPITNDLGARLRAYRSELTRRCPGRGPNDAFFPGPDGKSPLHQAALYQSFRAVLTSAGIAHGGRGQGPRLHDLRHTFAVFRLLAWYEADADVNAKLPVLASYLGHVGIESSQVYLHFVPEMIGEVTRRLESAVGVAVHGDGAEGSL